MNFKYSKKKNLSNISVLVCLILLVVAFKVFYKEENIDKKDSTFNKGFKWTAAKGEKIKVLLNQHPYSEAIIKKLSDFEKTTGIKVEYIIIPEENYANKVTTLLNNKSGNPDVFMTGSYYIWEHASKNLILNLNSFINNKNLTSSTYDINDFNKNVLNSLRWDLTPGNRMGTGGQWALPIGFEINAFAYNKRIFKERNLIPPRTMDELIELCKKLNGFKGKGTYGLALRGDKEWQNIVTSYITTYTNYGAKDFVMENGKLISKVNSKEAVNMTSMWVELIKTGVSPAWTSYKWYQAGADLGAGKVAMLFDADNNGYFQNIEGYSKEAGNIAWTTAPVQKKGETSNSNLWTWGLAINNYSKHQEASWLFLQYFTSKEFLLSASLNDGVMDPARESVLKSPSFLKKISNSEGYLETLKSTMNNSSVLFTPQPHFFEVTSEWANTLQDIVAGKYESTQAGMDILKKKMDKIVEDINLK